LVDGENNLHIAWRSRVEGQQKLYHASIDRDGQLVRPLLLSREDEDVSHFGMYLSPEQRVAFVWASQLEHEQEGIYHLVLHETASPTLLVSDGIDPFVLVDGSGTTHLAWLYKKGRSGRDIYYATLEGSRVVPPGGQKLTDFEPGESAFYYGPVVGADTSNLYVIWVIQSAGGGFDPTAARAFYVSFELGKPSLTNPSSLNLPAQPRPEYVDYVSPYGYNTLALLPLGLLGSDFVSAPAAVQSQDSELPVIVSLIVTSRGRMMEQPTSPQMAFEDPVRISSDAVQLAMVVFSEGKPVGYQLASNTSSASVLSTLTADRDANLHLAWIDTSGFRQYDVYYASTSPEAKTWLDRTSATDIVLGAANLIWGIISSIGLVPIAIIWNLVPVMWIFLFYVISGREFLERTITKIGLSVAIVAYIASKLLLLPGLSAGTPFLYQLPREIAAIVAVATPALIFILALGALVFYARRAESATLFKAYFVFALTDGLLTIVLYAPGLFNVG
jgi:hypothetical protein